MTTPSTACPACSADLVRATGRADMPASREYWQCHRCGLSLHGSKLRSVEDRNRSKEAHIADLKAKVAAGQSALRRLEAIPSEAPERPPPWSVLGLGAGFLLAFLLVHRLSAGD